MVRAGPLVNRAGPFLLRSPDTPLMLYFNSAALCTPIQLGIGYRSFSVGWHS